MNKYSYASDVTGEFLPSIFTGTEEAAIKRCPPGHHVVPGAHDPLCRRCVGGKVVPWQPPKPVDDDLRTWSWDAEAERWVAAPTDTAVAAQVRAERSRRMDDFAWRYQRYEREKRLGLPTTDKLSDLDAYSQALADITKAPGWPRSVTWPDQPGSAQRTGAGSGGRNNAG